MISCFFPDFWDFWGFRDFQDFWCFGDFQVELVGGVKIVTYVLENELRNFILYLSIGFIFCCFGQTEKQMDLQTCITLASGGIQT